MSFIAINIQYRMTAAYMNAFIQGNFKHPSSSISFISSSRFSQLKFEFLNADAILFRKSFSLMEKDHKRSITFHIHWKMKEIERKCVSNEMHSRRFLYISCIVIQRSWYRKNGIGNEKIFSERIFLLLKNYYYHCDNHNFQYFCKLLYATREVL